MAQKFLTNFTPPGTSNLYKFRAGALFYGTTSNSTTAMTVSIPGVTEYYTGLTLILKMGAQAASGCTLNVNGLGAKAMKYGANSVGTYFTSGATYLFVYDGTDFKAIHSYNSNTTYTSLKNPYALTIQGNGTTLTNGTYDGSAAKTVNITPASIGAAASSHTHDDRYYTESETNTKLNAKLDKLTYEWNKEYNAGGTAGYLLIGSFPMYDTNVTIDIDATTNTTYHGTVVIATQNVSTTSIGSAHTITVYGDPTGDISNSIRVTWAPGSRNYNVYFVPSAWSKNLIHIRAIGQYMDTINTTKICTQFTTGTAPATTSGLTVVNALRSNFNNFTYTHPTTSGNKHIPSGGSSGQILRWSADGTAVWGNDNNTTYSVVTSTANGLVPKFDAADGTIDSSSNDWVLTNNNGSIGWYKLPANAFKNDNTNYYHTPSYTTGLKVATGSGVGDLYIPTGTTSSLGVVKQHTSNDCTSYTSDEGATTPAAVKKAFTLFGAKNGIFYVAGNTSGTAGTWTGTNKEIPSLFTGLTIAYKIGIAGASATTLNLTTAVGASGAKTVRRNTGALTTHLGVGSIVHLTYDGTYWVWADYDSNTKNTAGSSNTSSKIFLVGATSQASSATTYSHDTVYVGTDGHLYDTNKQVSVVGHTHNYAGSSSAGGAANSVKTNLTIKLNGGTTEGTNLFTFNGSTAKTINITPSAIGAAAASHGTHVSYGTTTSAVNTTASAGTATTVSRSDHVHSLDKATVVAALGYTPPTSNTTYSAGTGLTLDGTTFKVTSANVSTMMNLLGEGTSPAQQNDYLIAQYAGGGTTTTTYHRRKVSNIITADNVKKALGTGTGTTKYLREDGTWVTPPNSNSAHSHSAGLGLTGSGSAGTSGTYTYKVNLVNEAVASNAASYTAGGTSKFYAVQLDKNNKLGVYVPWSNTTYGSMSINEGTTGTATTNRVLTAANLKAIINAHAPTKTGGGASGKWGISITGSAGSVAWGNITGKPSTFTPSSHSHDFITYKDTRADNQSPDDVQAGLTVHLKSNGTDGISDGGSYHAVLNVKDWGDYSGGPYWQSTVTENNNMYFRRSTAGTTWGAWQKVLSDNNYTNYTVTKTGSGASGTWGINVTGRARFLETKHQDGSAWYGDNYPLYAQWETSNICKIKCDNYYTKVDYANSATKATQDGSGNVITSKYVTLDTAQTISGTKTMTGSLKVSGRYAGSGDDEGIIVGFANNGYAGLCLGGPSEARSVFYFKSDGTNPFWRYNNGSASYDISHPSKSGTIALTNDLANYLPLSGGTLTGLLNITTNGKTTTFGCQNSSYSHYNTNADVGHWFNKNTYVQGNIYAGSSYNKLVLTEENYTNYAPTKTGGGASGTWGISISGNAATATKLATARTISLTGAVTGSGSFDGSGNLSIATTSNHNHDSTYVNVSGDTMTGTLTINKSGARTVYTDGTTSIWCGMNSSGNSFGIYNTTSEKYIIRMNGDVVKSGYPIYGAVWNDYAEFRICKNNFKAGQVVLENGDDTLSIASKRLQRGCSIISDTFGFAIGETDDAKCPIAVSGRVLAYGYESREEFKKHIGWPVCSGPNGTVSIMTEEEEEKYPSRIIGTISAVPDYETWGTGNIEVNNRIWIKIK